MLWKWLLAACLFAGLIYIAFWVGVVLLATVLLFLVFFVIRISITTEGDRKREAEMRWWRDEIATHRAEKDLGIARDGTYTHDFAEKQLPPEIAEAIRKSKKESQ
jgi:ABC-type multidrug transport system fused ATPase/permease subunit